MRGSHTQCQCMVYLSGDFIFSWRYDILSLSYFCFEVFSSLFVWEEPQHFWCPQIIICKMKEGHPLFWTFVWWWLVVCMFCLLFALFCYLPSIRILPKQRTWGATAALGAACLAGLSVETASWSVVKMNPSDVCFRAKEQLAISLEHQQRVGLPFSPKVCKIWDVCRNKTTNSTNIPWSWGWKQRSCRFRTCCFLVSYRGVWIVHLFTDKNFPCGRWWSNGPGSFGGTCPTCGHVKAG